MMEFQTLTDYEAEQAVLGAVLLKSESLDEIPFLESRDFSKDHASLFEVLKYMNSNDMPVDLITVTSEYMKFGKLDDIGGVTYLSQIVNAVPTASNIKYYANIVRSKAIKRRGVELADKIKAASLDVYDSDDEYFQAVEDLVDEIRPKTTFKMQSFAETREEYFNSKKSKAEKLKSGFKLFDEWAQLWRGWLYILSGRPGVGKTAKALQLAFGVARNNVDPGCILIFSQEMDTNEVKDRMVCNIASVNYTRLIENGGPEGFTDREWEKINEAYDEVEKYPIYVQDSAGVTIDEVRSTAKQMKKKHGKIALIILDYLQIMEIPQRKNENRAQAIGRVTRSAKWMARQMKFVFIMLSQLDRAVDDEEPKLKHLKESGSIEQDADVVEFLWHNGDYDGSVKIIRSIFAKGRNVGLNKFFHRFEFWYQRFVDYDKEKVEPSKKSGGRK